VDHGIAIIGAGYAGMAAAAELAAAGRRVTIFEASRTLGGRARAVELEGLTVDNGAHIFVGAYRETLRLMELVGAEPDKLLRRVPLHLEYPGELLIEAPPHCIPAPAPLHLAWALLAARGLSWPEKFAAIGFMQGLKRTGFRLERDLPAADYLRAARQPERLVRYLWEPLCVAALNTPLDRASMQVFANVLRDSLAAGREASDFLLPRVDFSRLFPEPAAAFVAARGGAVRRETRIGAITQDASGFHLDANGTRSGPYDRVIVAVAPQHLEKLVAGLPPMAAIVQQVGAFAFEPIVSAYVAYPENVRLPFAMVGVAAGTAQWLFDRGQLYGQPGLISAVISAHGRHEALDHDGLAAAIHAEVSRIVPGLPAPRWSRIITEKRATFACTPALPRPPTVTPLAGLYLAGDYVAGDYPATLEGTVRSGVAAARALLQTTDRA
jgi:squalene-associated FAD-dependent desaturase